MASESASIQLPMTLQQFLTYTGWEGDAPRERMSVALEYFQSAVPLGYLSEPVKDPVTPQGKSLGPNPWLLPRSGPTDPRPSGPDPHLVPNKTRDKAPINLCLLMQTIDFAHPVSVHLIVKGALLKAFHTARDLTGRVGRFFTLLQASPGSLAIPHDQMTGRIYEAACSFTSLASTVADAYVDWAMHRGVLPQYRHGGGLQFYVWSPELKLQPVPGPAQTPLGPVVRGSRSGT
ncbi:MAG: hypothetical protein A2Y76_11175 [Planctomycetes bacterium RBG_13_60_9]|nr:MAG: hypothetical protein A2Y76_11175 [Planctomycetes bacterium RBG_13_60_9]